MEQMRVAKRRRLVDGEPERALAAFAYGEMSQRAHAVNADASFDELGKAIDTQWWEQRAAQMAHTREVGVQRARAAVEPACPLGRRAERVRLGVPLQLQARLMNNYAAELGREVPENGVGLPLHDRYVEYASRVAAGQVNYADQHPAGPSPYSAGWGKSHREQYVALPPPEAPPAVVAHRYPKGPKKRGRKKKKGDEPKRSLSAYTYYVMDTRGATARSMPGASFKVVATEVGQRWKALTDEERAPYDAKAKLDMVKGSAARAAWKASVDAKHSAEVALSACTSSLLGVIAARPGGAAPVLALEGLHSGWGMHSAMPSSVHFAARGLANMAPPPAVNAWAHSLRHARVPSSWVGAGGLGPGRNGLLLQHPLQHTMLRKELSEAGWDPYAAASRPQMQRAYTAGTWAEGGHSWASLGGAIPGPLGARRYPGHGGQVGPAPDPVGRAGVASYVMPGNRGLIELPPRQFYGPAWDGSIAAQSRPSNQY